MTPAQRETLAAIYSKTVELLAQAEQDSYIPTSTIFEHLQASEGIMASILHGLSSQPRPQLITRAKGGESEAQVPISQIIVPDLWHCAMGLQSLGMHEAGRQVLECWHLAHDLKRHIEGLAE